MTPVGATIGRREFCVRVLVPKRYGVDIRLPGALKEYQQELIFTRELLKEAGDCAAKYFSSGVDVDAKDDGSPVTIADKEVEDLIRQSIESKFPDDSILGEERKEKSSQENSRRWIIDPIDGTMNFSRGIPIFSILMALEVDGIVKTGAVYNPIWKDMYYAASGLGAFKNEEPLSVSSRQSLEESLISFGGPKRFVDNNLWDRLGKLIESSYQHRGYGDYLGFAFVLEGKTEANIEVDLKPWDLAPMKILVEEAGGCYYDFQGGKSIYHGSSIVCNKFLGDQIKSILLGDKTK